MAGKLAHKVALVSGASRGIGRATALALAREGAAFIGLHYGNNADAARATVREIEQLGAKVVAIQSDLHNGRDAAYELWHRFQDAAVAATGEAGLDILVNNAGIAPAVALSETS